jgi:D-alanyl-D-alanine carboxypeptidase/D-alanyl-D-alanine-endopeptidase (penicillin-binding protein 4)
VNVRARGFTAAALAFLLCSCAARSAQGPARAASIVDPSSVEQLRRDLSGIFTAKNVDHAIWGVTVRSLKSDETLFSLNPHWKQTPASNQKVITSAVAAERLGWDFRYTTRIYSTGPLSSVGDLDGDLVIVSNGDPTINPRHPDRWGAFDAWAKQLYEKGLRRVGGQLIGDDNAFAEPGWSVGWAWDDLSLGYGAAVGALQYNENQIELLVGPGLEAGSRAIISVSPPGSGIILDHGVTTVAEGQPGRISLERIPGSSLLSVRGQVAIGSAALRELAAVPNPTLLYLNALREALARNGIFVGGNPLDIDDARVKPDYTKASLLLEDRSTTLASVIDVCLKWSRNEYAETLLRSLAPAARGPRDADFALWGGGAEATADAGLAVVAEQLTQWGVAPELYVARDGSGLSRNDYLAPEALSIVLSRLWRDARHLEPFRSTLPQSSVSGTLSSRMKDTPAAERVWAKTGSMSNVRSLAGYLVTLDGEPLVFAFMTTGFHVPASQIDAAMDEALVRLVRFPRAFHEE